MNILKGSWIARSGMLLVLYAASLWLSLWLAYQLRFDFNVPPEEVSNFFQVSTWVVLIQLLSLTGFRQFAGLLSYFSTPDLLRVFYAVSVSSSIVLVIRLEGIMRPAPPRGVILVDFVLSFLVLSALRLGFRLVRERFMASNGRLTHQAKRVGIVGAGDVGASLARELSIRRGLGLVPVAFFDDDKSKWHSRVHDIPVVGPPESLLDQKLNLELDEIIIAMPTAPAKRIGEVVSLLQKTRLRYATVPSIDQLATGQVKVSQLRSVEIQDLLGREAVELETESIRQILQERVVMVTGAGGSIGSELCRQITTFNPTRLLLVEQAEGQMFQIEQELIDLGHGGIVLPLVADILDVPRMQYIFKRFHPEVVFHAAAHKHVPMMENQPTEAIKNNTLGTIQLAEMASEFGADRFVLISTDKAINPTNVMGVSKRLAEVYVQALHANHPGNTKFMAVRFGNVLGSSGSVIPTFNKQIAAGGPVKVTHPDVTRYFMTIPEASGLVLQSAAQGEGGEIFVLDMGKPIKIVDLARQMIELSGLKPGEDIEIEFVGLRPGEKLFEELSHQGENFKPTKHPKISRFVCEPKPLEQVREEIQQLTANLHSTER
ncbi:MAG: polysaccharide biosynthesis protein, partial [Candidatus Omnitrophica bacterium]|nr:polysaccharide biosynthesis protein [Candidatus Omnitrophota bacterium]